jgi:hypothetical protein
MTRFVSSVFEIHIMIIRFAFGRGAEEANMHVRLEWLAVADFEVDSLN